MIVENFSGTYSQQVRIVGATERPASIPYRANMTLLDAMIAVGGLNQFAAGNKAKLVRTDRDTGKQREYALQINDLLRKGDSIQCPAGAGRRHHHPRIDVLRQRAGVEHSGRDQDRDPRDMDTPLAGAGGGVDRVHIGVAVRRPDPQQI